MADVIIVQQTSSDGTYIAPKTPEGAIYDKDNNKLPEKLENLLINRGNTIFISKWYTNTDTTIVLAVDEIGYSTITNKLYIGTSNGTAEELPLKTDNLYCYEGGYYTYNSTNQKLEYTNCTIQSTTIGNTNEFSPTTLYVKGDLIEKDGVIYRCIEDSEGEWAATEDNFTVYVMKGDLDLVTENIDYINETLFALSMGEGDFNQLVSYVMAKKYEGQQVMVVKYKKGETPSIANWTAELTKEYGGYDVWTLTNSGATVTDYRMWKNDQNLIGVLYMPITSKVKYLSFNNCQNLVEVMSSAWDTSGLITLETVFTSCKSLTYLDVSNWDISNVTTLYSTFGGCSSLASLDVSNWDTSNVTSLAQAFHLCQNLTTLNVSNWNTSKIKSLSGTFRNCEALKSLNVENWDVSNVTNMYCTFNCCYKLSNINVSRWNPKKVTNFQYTFYYCSSLTSLDISNWNVGSGTNFGGMFQRCFSLTAIDVSNWDMSKATTLENTFGNCTNLTSVNVSNWDVSNVTSFYATFNSCSSLTTLDVSNWDVSNATSFYATFNGCSKLTTIDVSRWNTSKATTLENTFGNCTNLTSVNVSNWDTSNVTNLGGTFVNNPNLISIDVSNWNTSKVTRVYYFACNCKKLTSLDLSSWDTSKMAFDSVWVFYSDTNITNLIVSKNFFRTAKTIDMSQFTGLSRTSFGNFVNNAKTAADEGIAGKGDGTVTELREVKLSSTQKAWTTECAVLTSAGYTII